MPDYGSAGATCNVEIELDAGLLDSDLDEFQRRARAAYIACQQAVYDELVRLQSPPAPATRDGLPSQARPESLPEPLPPRRNGTNGAHGSNGAHGTNGHADGTPRTGRALYAWVKRQEEEHAVSLLKYLNSWGRFQDFAGRIVDWDDDQVALAHAEAVRRLAKLASLPEHGGAE